MHALLARRHWIFDLDGTLTLAVHDFAALRLRLGLPPGAPILEAIAAAPPGRRAWLAAEVEAWEHEAVSAATPAPDALALLDHLAGGDYRVGVLTRNLRDIALATLSACGLAARFAPRWSWGARRPRRSRPRQGAAPAGRVGCGTGRCRDDWRLRGTISRLAGPPGWPPCTSPAGASRGGRR
ncbi:MAG: hypothetical protein R3F60_17225 [bacterium]